MSFIKPIAPARKRAYIGSGRGFTFPVDEFKQPGVDFTPAEAKRYRRLIAPGRKLAKDRIAAQKSNIRKRHLAKKYKPSKETAQAWENVKAKVDMIVEDSYSEMTEESETYRSAEKLYYNPSEDDDFIKMTKSGYREAKKLYKSAKNLYTIASTDQKALKYGINYFLGNSGTVKGLMKVIRKMSPKILIHLFLEKGINNLYTKHKSASLNNWFHMKIKHVEMFEGTMAELDGLTLREAFYGGVCREDKFFKKSSKVRVGNLQSIEGDALTTLLADDWGTNCESCKCVPYGDEEGDGYEESDEVEEEGEEGDFKCNNTDDWKASYSTTLFYYKRGETKDPVFTSDVGDDVLVVDDDYDLDVDIIVDEEEEEEYEEYEDEEEEEYEEEEVPEEFMGQTPNAGYNTFSDYTDFSAFETPTGSQKNLIKMRPQNTSTHPDLSDHSNLRFSNDATFGSYMDFNFSGRGMEELLGCSQYKPTDHVNKIDDIESACNQRRLQFTSEEYKEIQLSDGVSIKFGARGEGLMSNNKKRSTKVGVYAKKRRKVARHNNKDNVSIPIFTNYPNVDR